MIHESVLVAKKESF